MTRRAWSTSPLKNAAIISAICSPAQCDATLITPDRADGEQRQGEGVVAGVQVEARRRLGEQPGRRGRVTGGVLDADDGRHLVGQADQGLVGDLAAGPDGDVVDQHRQVGGRGDRPEVGVEAGLRGPAVVRRDGQDPGRPGVGRHAAELDGVGGVVGAGPGDHRDGDRLGDRPPQVPLLVVGQHRRLAGGAGDDEAVVAVLDEPAGEGGGAVEVQGAVRRERCHHGGQHGAETAGAGHQSPAPRIVVTPGGVSEAHGSWRWRMG